MKLLYEPVRRAGGTVAQVSYCDGQDFGAVGAAEQRGLRVFSPRGIRWRPCEGDNLLLLPVEGTEVCAGVLCHQEGLAGGELMLQSAGGASVVLRNSGDVVINGVTITRDGRIVPPGGEGAD